MTEMLTMIEHQQQHQRELLTQLQNRLLTTPHESISSDVYKQLMLTYLLLGKTNESKFLWENLPVNMKTDKEFQLLALIVSSLNSKRYTEFYQVCQRAFEHGSSYSLSRETTEKIQQLINRVTMENIQLIELAYKSISFDDLQHIFGLNRHTVEKIAVERQWKANEDPQFLHPRSNDRLVTTANGNLAKLAELVCFLER